jgi:ATP-binding cassette subfamily B protein
MGAAPRFMIEAAGFVVIALLALILADREGSLAGALPILGGLAIGAQRLLPLSQQLYQAWVHFTGNQAVLERVQRLLELPVDPAAEAEDPAPLPFASEVRLEKVSFSYPGAPSPAIDRVSLNIPRGSRIALVGRTGSGKTTLADLLMGLIAPQAGRITIDGTTLDATSRRAWQQCIAHVPQTVFLADTSIARNIAFGVPEDRIDREWVREAAIQSQLHEHIASLPRGYDTLVGERGARLSGGQRQRLGLARAIYKRAPLLVLDEATNALDPLTEQAVLGSLDALGREGRTIVIVAHSAATIAGCDLVFRLEKGRLV